ncbi:unnamed protein product [Linum trigynum]|uniref:Uncharacterized protein n=1 Tax=Linum trigynum TaxID=586398 RepID=A0AAV2F036_9ROSI
MVKEEADDVEAFLASLDPKSKCCPPEVVAKLIQSRAIGCIAALLERKVPHNRLDIRGRVGNCQLPLHYAAKFGFHEAIELLIRHWVPPNLIDSSFEPEELETGAIDYALETSCNEWNKKMEESRSGLLLSDLILWLPEWISDADNFNWWHTVKLLGRAKDEDLEKKIFEYARNGQAAKLLWLLLAVPDRVLSPTFLHGLTQCADILACPLLRDYSLRDILTAQLASLVADIWCCSYGDDPQLINSLEEQRSILTSSLLLLEVFQRAGTQLSNLMAMLAQKEKHQLSNSPIAQQVQAVLEGAGIPITSLNCPAPSRSLRHKEWDDDWPSSQYLAFLIQPASVSRSETLDSEFSRAIEKLCYHPCLKEMSPSAFKLLFIFCLPDMVEKMQCMLQLELKYGKPAKVIHPTYLAKLCFIYITEGRIVEFTAALMAGRVLLQFDNPLSPQMSDHTLGYKDYIPTLYDFLLHALRRVLDEEIGLTGKSEDTVTVQTLKEKKSIVASAFLLTRIFENSSQCIHRYLYSPRYKVIQQCRDLKMVVDDVSSLLEDSGFVLTPEDVSVDHLECFSSKAGVSRTGLEEGNLLSFVSHLQTTSCVKEKQATRASKAIMSTENVESSLLVGLSINKFRSRSYHSFVPRYAGSKVAWLPAPKGVKLITKRAESAILSDSILRKSWKFLTMTKMLRL